MNTALSQLAGAKTYRSNTRWSRQATVLVHAGLYLPLTAALGGQLYVQPYGYHEAERDVIR